MKRLMFLILPIIAVSASTAFGQGFNPTPINFVPDNVIEFKLNQPLSHLDLNNYNPSKRGIYVGYPATFRFYLRHNGWSNSGVFMSVRWDSDLNAGNGIQWSIWEENQSQNYYRTVTHMFPTPGKYTITFELRFSNTAGQSYTRLKQYDIYAAPLPTAVYADQNNNRLFYFVGSDGIYNRPAFLVEGFDPDNTNTPEVNYALGFDLVELARSQGYDPFIMEFANGGVDLAANKGVFLDACKFLHDLLGNTEAAVQVVGISMGGTIARYGLAWAEDNGPLPHPGEYIEHYVNTFISFDAPQQGAHVNTNLQEFIRDNGNSSQQMILQSVAAKQMLYEDAYGSQHDGFYEGLKALHNNEQPYGYTNGYPRRCLNFAVSNGNHNTNYPGRTTADALATLTIYVNIDALALLTFPSSTLTRNIYAQSRDLWPGSTFTHDLTTLSAYGNRMVLNGIFFQAYGNWRFQVNFNPGYTPTESSLDLEGYTRTPNGTLVGGTSWFNGTLEQTTFRRHEELTLESKNQVMSWLNDNRTRTYLGRPASLSPDIIIGDRIIITFKDHSAFEDGSRVERKIEGGSYQEIAMLPPNITRFEDPVQNLQPFTRYYYRFRSFKGNQYSPYSGEVSMLTQQHLQTTNQYATGSNGQRKVVRADTYEANTISHAVYESGGAIWYLRNDGSQWAGEKLIRLATTTCRNPSISANWFAPGYVHVHIAWEERDPANPNQWNIMYNHSENGGLSWEGAPHTLGQGYEPVCAGDLVAMVVWRKPTGLYFRIVPTNRSSLQGPVSGTDATSRDFSASGSGNTFWLTFVNGPTGNGSIITKRIDAWWTQIVFYGNEYPAAGYPWITDCRNSNVTSVDSYGRMFVSWDALGDGAIEQDGPEVSGGLPVRRIFVRERQVSGWKPLSILSANGGGNEKPAIGIDAGTYRMSVLWQWAGSAIARASRSLSQYYGWNWSTNLAVGIAPTQVAYSAGIPPWQMWTGTGGPPYSIVFTPNTNDAEGVDPPLDDPRAAGSGVTRRVSRQATINLDSIRFGQLNKGAVSGDLVLQCNRFSVVRNGVRSPLGFRTDSTHFSDWLGTNSFLVPSNADSVSGTITLVIRNFCIRDQRVSPGTPVSKVTLRVGTTTLPVRTITIGDLARLGVRDTVVKHHISAGATGLRRKTVTILQQVIGQDVQQDPFWSEMVSLDSAATAPGAVATGLNAQRVQLPMVFALHPNYPNPFNPVTKIRFDLPEASHVTLVVYDVVGRKIAEVAGGFREAGYQSTDWDASDQASGVYFARLHVRDEEGKTKFTRVNKLILLK